MKKSLYKLSLFLCAIFSLIWVLFCFVFLIEPYYLEQIVEGISYNLEWRMRGDGTSAYKIVYPTEEGMIELNPRNQEITLPNGKGMHSFKVDWKYLKENILEIKQNNGSGTIIVYRYIPEFNSYLSPIDFQYLWDEIFNASWAQACFSFWSSTKQISPECRFFRIAKQDKHKEFLIISYQTTSPNEIHIHFTSK